MGTSFGAKNSGIVQVDKRYLWLVNGCLEYHRPIITSACPLKRSQTSLRPKLVPILLHVSEVGNLRNLFISLSSIHLSTGLRGLKTTQRQGWRRAEILKLNWPIEDRQNEQRTCLIPNERASRPLSSNVSHGFSRLCVFEKWASQFGTALLLRITNIIIGSFISEVMHLICTKWGQVNFNLHLQDHISVIQKIIMGSGQFLR